MVRTRGTTLVELLVVMAVWSFIMVAVLSFYVYGTKVSRRHEAMSAELRAVQQVADKFNTVLRDAELIEVQQFPPTILFRRVDERQPYLPGCLLPNWTPQLEFIGIGPDVRRVGNGADPNTCKENAVLIGRLGNPGQAIMQLPSGMIGELRLTKGLLILSFNNPKTSLPQASPSPTDSYEKLESKGWKPMNHYFQFRGLTAQTRYRGQP